MKVNYTGISTGRGKWGGSVGTAWRGINILRKRSYPAQPNTDAQLTQRNQLTAVNVLIRDAFVDPDVYQLWKDWSESTTWPLQGGGSTTFPPYQSALKVMMARNAFGNDEPMTSLPLFTPGEIPSPPSVVASAADNVMTIDWLADVFTSQDKMQIVGCQIASASQHPNPRKGRVLALVTLSAISGTSDFFTWVGAETASSSLWCFWARKMHTYDKMPSPYKFLGSFSLTMPL